MKVVVYTGSFSVANVGPHEFERNTPTPVDDRTAKKLLRSSEFITLEEYRAKLAPPAPTDSAPATEPVVVNPSSSALSGKNRKGQASQKKE